MSVPTVTLLGAEALRGWADRPLREIDRETRAALGIATDRLVVMTGHQAEWWHPGIVAKFIGAEHIADRDDAAWSWVVVDHDASDPFAFRVPELDLDNVPSAQTVRFAPTPDRVSAHRLAKAPPWDNVAVATLHSVRQGVDNVRITLEEHADAPDAIEQWWRAMRDTLRPIVALPAPVRATALLRTPGGRVVLDRLIDDPQRAANAYNRAVGDAQDAGLATLHVGVDPGAIELPLWWIRPDGTRGRVFAGDLDAIDPGTLAPRALLMTALLRLHCCDLFFHGTGGFAYDRATEAWIRDWLGEELAPMIGITADMRLPLEFDAPDPTVTRRTLRRAWHDPSAFGDEEASSWKQGAVREIESLPRGSTARRNAYYSMHRMLETVRSDHPELMRRLVSESILAWRAHEARDVMRARDWAFVLHGDEDRASLRDAVHAALRR